MRDSAVAIIIPAYNAAATIGRAVKSALSETLASEVIVIDDASIDDTVKQAESAAQNDDRFRIISLEQNSGPSMARNRGIAASTAPWIGILDADDYFLPGRLQSLLAFADDADFIADDIWQVPEDNTDTFTTSLFGALISSVHQVTFAEFVISNITQRTRQRGELGFIKPIMRRRFLDQHNIRYREDMRLGEDYELYARALAHTARLILIPHRGYVAVVRVNSLSGQHSIDDLMRLRDCDVNLLTLSNIDLSGKKALRQHYLSLDCRLQWRLLIEAVKQRNIRAVLATFWRPYPVPLYLVSQLARQLLVRTFKR